MPSSFSHRRAEMVRTRIVARGITEPRLLEALLAVPRHGFVPDEAVDHAYADRALPIGFGQTISQPYMVASMTAALDVQPQHRVLEVGTGSGYQAAVLAQLAREVVTIERHRALADQAHARLAAAGCTNVRILVGDGSVGAPGEGPFDRILVTAGAPHVPAALRALLVPNGGCLVIPVGPRGQQDVVRITRHGDRFEETHGEACVFVPLVGDDGWPEPSAG
jgi:protein-L-isoaspartate(D-aspartate) O-methyltransferase